jgi:hypothetical protein
MRRICYLLLLLCTAQSISAQYVYTIKADSVKITNNCDTAELIIENHTQTVPGFLFNKGRGRTEFRKGFYMLNDSLYLLGADTLNINLALKSLIANNGLLKTGNTIQFGNDVNNPYGPAYQIRPTYYYQANQVFNWITGGSGTFTVSKWMHGTVDTAKMKDYHIARFAAPGAQGGLLMESGLNTTNPGPLSWLMWKNTNSLAATANWYLSEQFAALMEINTKRAVDGKNYASFRFHLACDTGNTSWDLRTVLNLYPAYQPYAGRYVKLPTANVKRLDISQIGADAFQTFNYDNPYSRLLVDAANYPFIFKNMPQSNVSGRLLVVDSDGKVWLGDSTSSLGGGGGSSCCPGKVKITSDVTTTSTTLSGSELSFAVNAGTYYKFRFVIVFATDATTTGIRLGLNAPSASVFSATTDVATGSDGTNARAQGSITSSGDWILTGGVEAANTNYIAIVEGIILPSVSGTVQLVFGSGTNGNQVSLKPGSMGSIETY